MGASVATGSLIKQPVSELVKENCCITYASTTGSAAGVSSATGTTGSATGAATASSTGAASLGASSVAAGAYAIALAITRHGNKMQLTSSFFSTFLVFSFGFFSAFFSPFLNGASSLARRPGLLGLSSFLGVSSACNAIL